MSDNNTKRMELNDRRWAVEQMTEGYLQMCNTALWARDAKFVSAHFASLFIQLLQLCYYKFKNRIEEDKKNESTL